jgi:hypothetical protein
MVGELRDHYMGQQPGGWDAFVDDLCRNGCLDQRFALITDPLATDVTLNGEYTRRVVEFLADVLTDALECAAALAMAVVGPWWIRVRNCRDLNTQLHSHCTAVVSLAQLG